MVLALHHQLHYLFQFGNKTFMHPCVMNTNVKIAPLKDCAKIALLYLNVYLHVSLQ